MKYLNTQKLFEAIDRLSIKKDKYLYDRGYSIDYEIKLGKEDIGDCETETIFKIDDFDDSIDEYVYIKNIQFNYTKPVKKEYYLTMRHIVYINGFKIYKDYRGSGHGFNAMSLILASLDKEFPNNDGIYLSVFKSNTSAINIYKKLGFKTVKDEEGGKVVAMKRKSEI